MSYAEGTVRDLQKKMDDAEEALKKGEDYFRDNPKEIMYLLGALRHRAYCLWQKYDEEKQYQEWVQKHKIKGYVCGYMTRQLGSQIIARQSAELYEKEKIELRKLANNPILSEAAKKTIRRALWMVRTGLWDHNQLLRIAEKKNKKGEQNG